LALAVDVRASYPAVGDITHYRHVKAFEVALLLADRQKVEEGLRGVLVRAVSGVHDGARQLAGQQLGGPGRRVTDNDHVGTHRGNVLRGVDEALALARARSACGEVDDVGRQPFPRDLERGARARGRLVEEVHDRLAAERRDFLDLAPGDLLERRGSVDQQDDLARLEVAHREQILAGPAHARPPRVPRWPAGLPRRALAAAPPRSRAARSAGSCRCSPAGSAARGARGRSGTRAGWPWAARDR